MVEFFNSKNYKRNVNEADHNPTTPGFESTSKQTSLQSFMSMFHKKLLVLVIFFF